MLIWSTWGLMIRLLNLPPVVVLFYTSLIAGITVPLVLSLRGELDLSNIGGAWHLFAGLALASIVNNITYFFALGNTTVSNAVFTHYTAPVFVALLAPLVIQERLQRSTMLSLPVATVGMVMIVAANDGPRLGGEHTAGIIAGTASGLAYAVLILLSRKLSRMLMHHKAVVLILWTTTIATAPAALMTDHALTSKAVLLLLLAGLAHSTFAPLLYFSALRRVLAQHAAILGYIEPMAAVPLAFLFLAEHPTLSALLGGILILLSGYLVVRRALRNGHRKNIFS